MRDELGTTKRRRPKTGAAGKRGSFSGEKLAVLLGIAGLKYLTDDEVGRLIDFLHFLSDEAAEAGFREGWNCGRAFAECDYNGHGVKLLGIGPKTEH